MADGSRSALLLGVAGLLLGCSGEATTEGFGQPLRVLDAQFRAESLPGLPALTADDLNSGVMPTAPAVTSITLPNSLIPLGEPSRGISGRASLGAAAVGVRFADLGSGYWLVPTTSADVVNGGEVEWRLRAAFSRDIKPGLHRLLFAAVDEQGHSGTQGELNVCLVPEVPDDGNSCDPTVSPPALVISLDWDSPVDLDLRVITPSGKVVDSKHPSTAVEDDNGDLDLSAPGIGVIDHDAFASCAPDGRRRENLVFQSAPPPGTYLIYANLYDSCGERDVHFNVSLHVAEAGSKPDTFAVKETYRQSGELQALQENGGAKLGMFVTSFVAH
jgi:hypothetical protein